MEPYEPSEPGYDWDYDSGAPAEHHPPTILWGRIAVLFAFVLLAFLIGRWTAGGGGIDQAAFDRVKEERDTAQDQVETLEAEVTDLEGQIAELEDPNNDGTQNPTDDETDAPAITETEPYTVQDDDTLRTIAEKAYGDPADYDGIVSCNPNDVGPAPDYIVHPGDELAIPLDADAGCT
jgi:cell division protein FtsB